MVPDLKLPLAQTQDHTRKDLGLSFSPKAWNMSGESLDSSTGGTRTKLNIQDIHKEWDAYQEVRDHLRADDAVLFGKGATESIKLCCLDPIYQFLTPLLLKMAETTGSPQPPVDPLRDELEELYRKESKSIDQDQVIHDSWITRKLLGFVKMKTRLKKPSIVSCLNANFLSVTNARSFEIREYDGFFVFIF